MNTQFLTDLLARGGPVMIVIMALSVALYSQCFSLLIMLRQSRALLKKKTISKLQVREIEAWQVEMGEGVKRQKVMLGAMIAGAPLLGLLGTVSGMARTFESLSSQTGTKSMEGLAGGISEVLVATESGLAVAIPALVLVYLAHREIDKQQLRLSVIKEFVWGTS